MASSLPHTSFFFPSGRGFQAVFACLAPSIPPPGRFCCLSQGAQAGANPASPQIRPAAGPRSRRGGPGADANYASSFSYLKREANTSHRQTRQKGRARSLFSEIGKSLETVTVFFEVFSFFFFFFLLVGRRGETKEIKGNNHISTLPCA